MKRSVQMHTVMGAGLVYLLLQFNGIGLFHNWKEITELVFLLSRVILALLGFLIVVYSMKNLYKDKLYIVSIVYSEVVILMLAQMIFFFNHDNHGSIEYLHADLLFCIFISMIQNCNILYGITYENNKSQSLGKIKLGNVAVFTVANILLLIFLQLQTELALTIGAIITGLFGIVTGAKYYDVYDAKYKERKKLRRIKMITIFRLVQGAAILASLIIKNMTIVQVVLFLQTMIEVYSAMQLDNVLINDNFEKIHTTYMERHTIGCKGNAEQAMLVSASRNVQRLIEKIHSEIIHYGTKPQTTEFTAKYIEKVNNNCTTLKNLNNVILQENDDKEHEMGEVPTNFAYYELNAVLGKLVGSIEPYAQEKRITLEYKSNKDKITAEVDKTSIERLVVNLISNAIKYNKVNGLVEVSLEELLDGVAIRVRDTGIGIPAKFIPVMYEKYSRVNSLDSMKQEGSGIGMSIVRAVVNVHHGTINIDSVEGEGTTFTVKIPFFQPKSEDTLMKNHYNTKEESLDC